MTSQTASRTALVLGHIQAPITDLATDPTYLERLAAVARQARAKGIPVIYVTISFRAGYSEPVPGSPRRERMESAGVFIEGVSNSVHDKLRPEPRDIVIRASRVSGFANTDLEVVLRSSGIDSIALAGTSTGGVVLGTVVDARDKDFGSLFSATCVWIRTSRSTMR
ncbi:cysteine hydrolase family protein [Nocardia sp. NPDC051900]|uniref:cysteine hydrolase family protein n=1 Tax=Nocardia sp. NPDC051900 TaxID=3364326 RepID=UPI0037952192